jgi:hypothetical protein
MQHAEKEKQKFSNVIISDFPPHKLKRTQIILREKKSTYELKRGLNYTENRARTAFNKYLYTKEKENIHFSPLS